MIDNLTEKNSQQNRTMEIKEEDVVDGNELIASFMEFDIAGNSKWVEDEDKPHRKNGLPWLIEYPGTVEDLEYHSNWSWLMPVVEKIESMGYHFLMDRAYDETRCYFTHNEKRHFQGAANGARSKNKIEAAYLCVVDFIKWDNKIKSLSQLSQPNSLT